MRHHPRLPLVGLALSFIAGTWAGLRHAPTDLHPLIAAIVLLALITAVFAVARRPGSTLMGAICTHGLAFLIAWLNADLQTGRSSIPSLDSMANVIGTRVELVGVVDDEPADVLTDARPKWRFPLQVEKMRLPGETVWRQVTGTVRLTWYAAGGGRFPHYGDEWQVAGRLRTLENVSADKRPRRTFLFLSTGPGTAEFLSPGHGSRMIQYCLDSRNQARRVLATGIEHHTNDVAVLDSLLLGYRSQMPQELYRAYARTGTLHIFAISGSHVVILAAVIVFALGMFRVRRTRWVLFVGPLIVFYTVMTGLQPSAVRACIMAIVFMLAPLLGRQSDIFSSLAVSAILILAVVPSDLFDIGAVLSFTAVLGIVLLYPICIQPLRRLFQPDPLRLQPESAVILTLRAVWNEFSLLLATSVAAWLVSTPLTAYYFQLFSPIALLGNLLAIPLASLIIVTGSLSLVTGSCVPVMAEIFNHANLVLASWLTGSMQFFASLPGAYLEVPPPSLWLLGAFYALLACWVALRRNAAVGPSGTPITGTSGP